VENLEYAAEIISDAKEDDYESQYRLAIAKIRGYCMRRDVEGGLNILRRVSDNFKKYRNSFFDTIVRFRIQLFYKDAFDYCASKPITQDTATRLSLCYAEGIGTEKDVGKAIEVMEPFLNKAPIQYADIVIGYDAKGSDGLIDALNSSSSDERYSRLSLLDYKKNGATEENVALMKKAVESTKPWAMDMMMPMVSEDSTLEWKFSVYSSFANCSPLDVRKEVFPLITKAEGGMRSLQLHIMSLLEALNKICDSIGVDVIATAGTLLGAARHGGFIPWDDDIDVLMFEDDILALKEHLFTINSPYYVNEHNKFGHFYKFKSCENLGWIDLFPMESILCYDGYTKTVKSKVVSGDPRYPDVDKIVYQCARNSHPVIVSPYLSEVDMYPLEKMKFERIMIYAPHNVDKFLTILYDRYMDLPRKPKAHISKEKVDSADENVDLHVTKQCLRPLSFYQDKDDRLKWINKVNRVLSIDMLDDLNEDIEKKAVSAIRKKLASEFYWDRMELSKDDE